MSVRIANPAVIAKIERLALATGQGKSAAVEAAIDRMLADLGEVDAPRVWSTFDAIIAQLHRLPPRADAFEPVAFDEFGPLFPVVDPADDCIELEGERRKLEASKACPTGKRMTCERRGAAPRTLGCRSEYMESQLRLCAPRTEFNVVTRLPRTYYECMASIWNDSPCPSRKNLPCASAMPRPPTAPVSPPGSLARPSRSSS